MYRAAQVEGYVPRVFCILGWLRKNLSETPTFQRGVEAAFSLKVNPQPLDYINEPNLTTYGLAFEDNDETNSTLVATTLTVTMSLGLVTQDKAGGLASTTVNSSPVFLAFKGKVAPARKSETTKLPVLISKTILIVSTSAKTP